MSHFTTIATKFSKANYLLKALAEVGFKQVETHATPQPLYGFQGDVRAQTAEIIVRRKYVGSASNDIGFARQTDGTFQAIISAYDRSKYGQPWLDKLSQRYAYHVAKEQLAEQGFSLLEENQADGRIHLVARRAV